MGGLYHSLTYCPAIINARSGRDAISVPSCYVQASRTRPQAGCGSSWCGLFGHDHWTKPGGTWFHARPACIFIPPFLCTDTSAHVTPARVPLPWVGRYLQEVTLDGKGQKSPGVLERLDQPAFSAPSKPALHPTAFLSLPFAAPIPTTDPRRWPSPPFLSQAKDSEHLSP